MNKLETCNFHLYIGSKRVRFALRSEINSKQGYYFYQAEDLIGFCISKTEPQKALMVFENGTESDLEEYLDDMVAILRPLDEADKETAEALAKIRKENVNMVAYYVEALCVNYLIKEGFDLGLVPRERCVLTTELNPKKVATVQKPLPQTIMALKAKLNHEFGVVHDCEEYGNMFHVKITHGFSGKARRTFECMNAINEAVGDFYPKVHKCETAENLFHFILKS